MEWNRGAIPLNKGFSMWVSIIFISSFAFISQAIAAQEIAPATVTATDLASLSNIGGHASGAINISPDGRWVVFQLQTPKISDEDYDLTWMAISSKTGKAMPIANGGEVLLNPGLNITINGNIPPARVKWAPDSKSFVYLVRRNGQTQLWQSSPDRAGQVQLTNNAGDVMEFTWSPDGSKLYFKAGLDPKQKESLDEAESARGFLYDYRFAPFKSAQPAMQSCGTSYGNPITSSLDRACEPALWVYEVDTKSERLSTDEERDAIYSKDDSTPAPKMLVKRAYKRIRESTFENKYAWLENTDTEVYQGPYAPLNIFALIDGNLRRCSKAECRAYDIRGHQDMWWSANEQEVIFLRRDGPSYSMTGLYGWTPSTGDVRNILQSDDWLSDCAPAHDTLICLHESWTQPRNIVSVSLEDGTITTLYEPNPEFAGHRFSKIEKLEWEDAYGNSTHAHLVYPINYQPGRSYPLVIVSYLSRGFLRGGVGDEYPIFPLAAEGFFVLSQDMPIDYELAAKSSELNSSLLKDQYLRKSVLSSQEYIIERLAEVGLIDRARIAMTGLSEGQMQVSYALIHTDIIAAAIASGAWGSVSSFYLSDETFRAYEQSVFGLPDDPASLGYALSVGLNADRVNAPLLINVSDEEFLGAVENVARLKDAGRPIEMYVFPDEYHIKWQPQHRLAIYRRNIQWLKFWLKGEEEVDAVSPGQYDRWRKMRDERCAWDEPKKKKPSYCEHAAQQEAVH